MRSSPFLALPLLLAACYGAETPPVDSGSPEAAHLTPAPDPPAAELPDLADPRLFLDLASPAWEELERSPPVNRAARLRELGIVPVRRPDCETAPEDDYDPCGERLDDFHFVDFSGDGVDDVIYQGPWFLWGVEGLEGREGTRLRLHQVRAGRAVEVLDHHGSLQRVWQGAPGEPMSFRTVHHGCCADPAWTIEYFRPVRGDGVVRYEAYRALLGRYDLEMPRDFLAQPRRVTVANERYLLRSAPAIVDAPPPDEEDWPQWPGRGNAMAEYNRGARGMALAARTDGTGRVWWFVRMDGATPPHDAQVRDHAQPGAHAVPLDRLGWMSSRFLEVAP
jgi:hypothetical protein